MVDTLDRRCLYWSITPGPGLTVLWLWPPGQEPSSQHQAEVLLAPTSGRHWHRTSGHLAASTLYRPHSAPPPRHPAPASALDVVMAGLVWWCVSAVVPRLGCECGDDGRPRQSRGQRRPAPGTGGLLIAGHCPPVSHCLPQHQNTIRLLYFFWASYFICSIHSIFIKWSEKTQINKCNHYHWHTNWWLMAERRLDVCLL